MREAEFQSRVIVEAERCGWMHYHTYLSYRSVPGFPDLVLIKKGEYPPGRFPALVTELKTGKAKERKEQANWLLQWSRSVIYGVDNLRVDTWRPTDTDYIIATLENPAATVTAYLGKRLPERRREWAERAGSGDRVKEAE